MPPVDKTKRIIDLAQSGGLREENYYTERDSRWLRQRAFIWDKFSATADFTLKYAPGAVLAGGVIAGGANGVVSAKAAEAFFTYPFYVIGGGIFGAALGSMGAAAVNSVRNIFFDDTKPAAQQGMIVGLVSYIGIMLGQGFNKTYSRTDHHHVPVVDNIKLPHQGTGKVWGKILDDRTSQISNDAPAITDNTSKKFDSIEQTVDFRARVSKQTRFKATIGQSEESTFTSRLETESRNQEKSIA